MNRTVATVLAVVALVAVVPVAPAAASDHVDFTADGGSAGPGETVTIEYTVTNSGSKSMGAIVDVTGLPDGVTVTDNSSADGVFYDPDDVKWANTNLSAGESWSPTVTVRLPDDADGEYDIRGVVKTNGGNQLNATATVSVDGDGGGNPVADYANDEGVVEAQGLFDAAADFRNGGIDAQTLFDVAAAFRSGNPVT